MNVLSRFERQRGAQGSGREPEGKLGPWKMELLGFDKWLRLRKHTWKEIAYRRKAHQVLEGHSLGSHQQAKHGWGNASFRKRENTQHVRHELADLKRQLKAPPPLPNGWTAIWDPKRDAYFYRHSEGETQWQPPPTVSPSVCCRFLFHAF